MMRCGEIGLGLGLSVRGVGIQFEKMGTWDGVGAQQKACDRTFPSGFGLNV